MKEKKCPKKIRLDTIKQLEKIINRKNKLLEQALDQLLQCEWEVSLSVVASIEKDLGKN